MSAPPSYIVFLCAHDPFDDGIPAYTIERTCLETGRVIDSGAHWLAFNCRAYARAEDEGLRNLLEYLDNGRVPDDDALLGAIDRAVARANADRKWVRRVLSVNTIYDDARFEGLAEGRAEGREVGRAEGREEGLEEGRAEGLEEGRAEGRAEGHAAGLAEGEARLSRLIDHLLAANRIDDVRRATADPAFREELFEEFSKADAEAQ